MMELYDKIKNITGKNNEEGLKDAIITVRNSLNGLLEERMCKVYSSYLFEELKRNRIPSRLINTIDLGFNYEHFFVLVPANDNGYFLADLTFSQFNKQDDSLNSLLVNGYQFMDDDSLKCYFDIIEKEDTNYISCDDVFYSAR